MRLILKRFAIVIAPYRSCCSLSAVLIHASSASDSGVTPRASPASGCRTSRIHPRKEGARWTWKTVVRVNRCCVDDELIATQDEEYVEEEEAASSSGSSRKSKSKSKRKKRKGAA